jgi:predicted RNA-binding protein
MKNKFEIKAHDGPGRLGKIEELLTPNIINENSYSILWGETTSYNIQREIAEWSVEKTIEEAIEYKESEDKCEIAIIPGGKHLDLRLKSVKNLESLGYNGFIIANGDELILHPRDLVETIVAIRENIKANSYLIFPFAETSFIPLLSYLGIDGFLSGSDEYYSYLNVMMTPTKNYDLNIYDMADEMSQKQLFKHNQNVVDFVLKEVREHMKNGTLRNLVEERSVTSPQNISALRILDKSYSDYLEKYTQLY